MLVTWFEKSEWSVERNSSMARHVLIKAKDAGREKLARCTRSRSVMLVPLPCWQWMRVEMWTVFRHLTSQSRASAFRLLTNVWHGSAIVYEYSLSLWVKTREWATRVKLSRWAMSPSQDRAFAAMPCCAGSFKSVIIFLLQWKRESSVLVLVSLTNRRLDLLYD